MKKIAILGGGIGGLTVAHQLAKTGKYNITIYEAKDAIGGLARSDRTSSTGSSLSGSALAGSSLAGCATEYCWRVFFGFYDNFLKLLSEIPRLGGGTARDNLTVYKHVNISDPLSIRDSLAGASNILLGLTSSDARLDADDSLTWWGALSTASNSNIFREIGGWLGMDRLKGSYRSVIKVGMEQQMIPAFLDPNYKDYVTTKPTSEAVFEPWQKILESRNVTIHPQTSVVSIAASGGRVISATLSDGSIVQADYIVLNLPIEVLERVLIDSPSIDPVKVGLDNITKLREECLHFQLSFQLYFSRRVTLGDSNAFLLVESPWDLIVLSYDSIYATEICTLDPTVKGAWSVAATTAYIPGVLYGKTMAECSEGEIKEELWAQLSRSTLLQKLVFDSNGFGLDKTLVQGWAPMWPSFDTSAENGRYRDDPPSRTTEPKFTNNAGSYTIRPGFRTYLPNLFISTAYVKETIDIFSMEAAVIAGKFVANAIDTKAELPTNKVDPWHSLR